MGKSILCLGKYAEKSYHLEAINLSIYSIEELCFYLQENAYLLEVEFMSIDLTNWLKLECELPELASKLAGLIKRKCSLAIFVKTLLEDTFYCEKKEIGEIETLILNNSFQNKLQKRKNLGDYFVKKRKLNQALYIYENLVIEISNQDLELLSKVHHNIGVIHAQFFEFEKAAFYFKHAYQLKNQKESYICYLLAKRMSLSEQEYVAFIGESKKNLQMSMEAELIVERVKCSLEDENEKLELEEILAYKKSSYASEYYYKISELIGGWKKQYRGLIQ